MFFRACSQKKCELGTVALQAHTLPATEGAHIGFREGSSTEVKLDIIYKIVEF